jgi:hypothetical protein
MHADRSGGEKDMGEYNWQQIRERAASVLGYPDAATEQPIIDQFEDNPAAVSQAVEKIVSRVRAGKLQAHAGWLIVGREAEAIGRPAPDVVASDEGEKQRRLAWALKWVDRVGCYFDRWEAVEDELFGGSTRPLSDYADDRALRDLVERHWREQRPLGEAAEAASEQWCLKCAEDRRRVKEADAIRAARDRVGLPSPEPPRKDAPWPGATELIDDVVEAARAAVREAEKAEPELEQLPLPAEHLPVERGDHR